MTRRGEGRGGLQSKQRTASELFDLSASAIALLPSSSMPVAACSRAQVSMGVHTRATATAGRTAKVQ